MKRLLSVLTALTLITSSCGKKAPPPPPSPPDPDYATDIDALLAELDARTVDPSVPVSANINGETKAVFDFLRENYGEKILSGQQYMKPAQQEDLVYYGVTGDLPAIKGFDFIFSTFTDTTEANNEQVDMAIDWHVNSGGLVAMCWHWKVPKDVDNPKKGVAFYKSEITNFSYINAVTPGTKEYEVVIRDIDTIAAQLRRMEEAGVPVLFRPLHEAGGSWFWWGKENKETVEAQCYQKLWYTLFDRLENHYKLSNLIWVWNGQNKYMTVHPNTYDIAGTDVYPGKEDHSALVSDRKKLADLTEPGKMLALTECGYIPDPDEVFGSEAKWLYYMPWYGDFIFEATKSGTAITDINGTPSVNKKRLSEEFLKDVFADERVVTWNKLPSWTGERGLPGHLETWKTLNDLIKGES